MLVGGGHSCRYLGEPTLNPWLSLYLDHESRARRLCHVPRGSVASWSLVMGGAPAKEETLGPPVSPFDLSLPFQLAVLIFQFAGVSLLVHWPIVAGRQFAGFWRGGHLPRYQSGPGSPEQLTLASLGPGGLFSMLHVSCVCNGPYRGRGHWGRPPVPNTICHPFTGGRTRLVLERGGGSKIQGFVSQKWPKYLFPLQIHFPPAECFNGTDGG